MAKIGDMELVGASGVPYKFEVYHSSVTFAKVGGVYSVTKRVVTGGKTAHSLIYVGETDNLRERFQGHHRQDCFDRNGANSICVHRDDRKESRLQKEADLSANKNYPWTCNRT
jgi:hypothetical protein